MHQLPSYSHDPEYERLKEYIKCMIKLGDLYNLISENYSRVVSALQYSRVIWLDLIW